MSDKSDMLKRVEVEEGWLRETMPADPPYAIASLKLRVRIGVHEAWLAGVTAEDSVSRSGETIVGPLELAAVRDAVRGAIDHQRGEDAAEGAVATPLATRGDSPGSGRARRRYGRVLRWSVLGGGLAAAAAVLLAVLPLSRKNALRIAESGDGIAQRLDDFAAVLVETEAISPWADLEADVRALEDTLADGSVRAWNEEEIDDLTGELEALVSEIGQGS